MNVSEKIVYWIGEVPEVDDFGMKIKNQFVDGKTTSGPWGIMTPDSFSFFGVGKLGPGLGQRYLKQTDGKWMKVEG